MTHKPPQNQNRDLAQQHWEKGNALLREGNIEGGIKDFREAIRLNPDLAAAHHDLGVALSQKGNKTAALVELREAVRLNPQGERI